MTLAFVALSFVLAFAQRWGWASSDTKIDLHVDPARFLGQVASVWTTTTDLGNVHSAQYSGYVWPMAPFFAAFHGLGLSPWVVQRLWLGLMFALSVWGLLRLLDVLVGRPRGVVHLVAGAFIVLNPYTVVFSGRTSITLLGYAALPWLLLISYHGVRAGGRLRSWAPWWWAAAFALILTSTGGGVNAAVVFWMLVGPLVLMIYEPAVGNVRWRASGGFLARVGVLGVLASLWWIVPLLVHVHYGIDFLRFTEQPGTIWATNSLPESLRLMGYWTSYIGIGFGPSRPFFSYGGTMLFNPLVVASSLLIPAVALGGLVWTSRWRRAPLLLWLVIVGAAIMAAGFPAGTPLRHGMEWVYHHIDVLRFLRTTNKAAPLVAVGLAGLLGLAAREALARLRQVRSRGRRRAGLVLVPVLLAALIALAALPLVRGGSLDSQLLWKRIPSAWRSAGGDLDRTLPANTRAVVLPGQVFAYYTWGGTVDAILPRLTRRPVAVRYETPYSDLHANDLLTTVDDLVQQRRLVPGQLAPLLGLMGTGAVVTGADDDLSRSGAIAPAAAAQVLAGQGLSRPSRSYGPPQPVAPAAGDIGPPARLPQVRRYDIAGGRGIVHLDPLERPTVIDGDAEGLAATAAFGALPRRAAIFYAADETAAQLRAQAAAGADVVVTDSNRRRTYLPQYTQQNHGPTLGATTPIDVSAAQIDPFAGDDTRSETVSLLRGASFLQAPGSPLELQFPEHAPIAAFDGDPATSWVADVNLKVSDRWVEIGLPRPRDVPYVDVTPLQDAHARVAEIDVNGVRARVGAGTTRVPVHLHHVSAVRVTLDDVVQPAVGNGGPGGLREVRIPGVHVHELLRAPVLAGSALAGRDLRRSSLTYVLQRTTGDDPFRRSQARSSTVLNSPGLRGDPERLMDRLLFTPAARRYSSAAWVHPDVRTPDSVLDRMAGLGGSLRMDSSSRFQDQARYRASSAFDGDPRSAWIATWLGPGAWIGLRSQRPLRVRRLELTAPPAGVRRPTRVRAVFDGGSTGALAVGADGSVVLPRTVRTRSLRLVVLDADFAPGTPAAARSAAAVGIGELRVAGLPVVAVPRSGPLRAGCGSVRVAAGGAVVRLRPRGTVGELDAGQPLRATGCAGPVALGAGTQRVRALPGPFSIDLLSLRSAAPSSAAPATAPGVVTSPGRVGTNTVEGVRVALRRPAWLVLGQSFSPGWRATCDGASLGAPRVIDGYANGWRAPARCRAVAFAFAPQDGVRTAYAISAITCALLLAGLFAGALAFRRRRAREGAVEGEEHLADAGTARVRRPMALAHALVAAAIAAVPLGAYFALRAGVGSFLLLAFVLWRGFAPRTLIAVAAALLGVVVPLIYLLSVPGGQGGSDFLYAIQTSDAHWVTFAALVLLAVAGARVAGAQRSTKAKTTARAE